MAKKILVVDDSASIRKVVGLTLKGAGYEPIEAVDGQDAIAKLSEGKVSLIICDINMPNMDGITFLKTIRQDESHKFTPVIMLTTESQEEKKWEGQEAGARAWIVKPFKPDQLLTAVSRLIL